MEWIWVLFGVTLAGVGLIDVFLTVLHYENPGILAVRAYRLSWNLLRRLTAPLPARTRSLIRSMGAPVMVALNLVGWLGFQIVGFALIYYPGIRGRDFDVGRSGRSFLTALYFSAATLTSLSFSDVEPHGVGYHMIAAIETLVGLGILTMAISFVLNLYQVLEHQGVLSVRLFHHSGGANQPEALLAPHFAAAGPNDFGTLVRELHGSLTEFHEGMRRYPIVWYFHTRRPYRSLPYIFWFIGAAGAALRWGLPGDHPATCDPWLPGLVSGYHDVLDQVARGFLPGRLPPIPQPVSQSRFVEIVRSDWEQLPECDEELRRFLQAEQVMCDMARVRPEADLSARYERYRQWSQYAGRGRQFVEAASRDLGLDPARLYDDPRATRF